MTLIYKLRASFFGGNRYCINADGCFCQFNSVDLQPQISSLKHDRSSSKLKTSSSKHDRPSSELEDPRSRVDRPSPELENLSSKVDRSSSEVKVLSSK